MPVSEKPVEFSISIDTHGVFSIRKERVILDNDGTTELTRLFSVTNLEPGSDVSTQPNKIKQLTAIVWTAQIIADWNIYKATRV